MSIEAVEEAEPRPPGRDDVGDRFGQDEQGDVFPVLAAVEAAGESSAI